MKRRELIGAGTLTIVGGSAVGTALGVGPLASNETTEPDQPEYLGREPVVYDRDDLQLRALHDSVRRGETNTFEIKHTGSSEAINLGCNIHWALQVYQDEQWKHVTWTGGRYYDLCYTAISAGQTVTETVPLSRSDLAENSDISEVVIDLTPGKYRFVLLGSPPYLAVNFNLFPAE